VRGEGWVGYGLGVCPSRYQVSPLIFVKKIGGIILINMLFWTLGLFFFFNLKNVLREEELGSLNLTTVVSWVPF